MTKFDHVEDSGERQEYETGARRDTRKGKGRYDLIPSHPMHRLAVHFENGAEKYSDRNWEKGIPLSRYLDSCMRHLWKVLDGQDKEDHAAAVAWNIFCYMATKQWIEEGKLPSNLDDLSSEPTVRNILLDVFGAAYYELPICRFFDEETT